MPSSHPAASKSFPCSTVLPRRPKAPAVSFVVLATLAAALLSAASAQAQSACAPATAQLNHDRDLARDCATGLCVERACVNTLYRVATLCGHGFFGLPSVLIGGQTLPVLPSAPGLCGANDESLVVGLDEASEGQHKLVVLNGAQKSEAFFIKVGELAGPRGPAGPAGPMGPAGATGAPGPKGDTGPQGAQGIAGANGATGSDGPAGAQGPMGAQGLKGDKGDTGPQGAVGSMGPAGAAGPAGAQGAQGLKGDTGLQGVAGATGAAGAAGSTGAQGPKGDRGDTGPQGLAGVNGTNGATGPQGPAGPAGTSNLAISAGVYTIGPSCANSGVLTLDSVCHYPVTTTIADLRDAVYSPADAAICLPGDRALRYVITTPACAANCTAGARTPRTTCVVDCSHSAGPDSVFSYDVCGLYGTIYDVTCDCDNTLLGYLVK